ncbi:hypothetical protein EON80_10335 [bacterium]|nr:MAG: hypothetical protein EON80_10335 [bacterium]
MSICWATIPLLLGCVSLVVQGIINATTPPLVEGEEWDSGTLQIGAPMIVFFLSILLSAAAALGGLLTGVISGLWAPAVEPSNPLLSGFFRRVGWQTFWMWVVIFIVAIALVIFTAGNLPFGVTIPMSYALSLGWHLKSVINEELK